MANCAICNGTNGIKGIRVKNDFVVDAARRIKKLLNKPLNNNVSLCGEHVKDQVEKRKKFEKAAMISGIVIMFVVLVLVVLPVFLGRFDFRTIIVSIIFIAIIVLFTLIFRYSPSIEVIGSEVRKEEKIKKR
ncbi:TPA: hypothetical protein HA238_03215 [Candidatus Micrarchaeota archaeon]|nr:hypothetical protein [Candidatus Micrarchaeota archaeon]